MTLRPRNVAIGCALAVLAALLPLTPLFSSDGDISLLTTIAIAAYLGTSWNILGGLTGQLSFGHSIFFGVGAYATAVLFVDAGWHPLLGGALGVALSVVLGLAMGWVGFRYRMSHLTFALATAALAEISLYLVKGSGFLGGAFGVTLPFKAGPSDLHFADPVAYYWVFLGLLVLALAITYGIRTRRLGTYLVSVREDEQAAEAVGIDVVRVKLIAMAVSAALTGLGGVAYAHYLRFLEPDAMFGFERALEIVIPAMLGGTAVVLGPLVGGIVYGVLLEETRTVLDFRGGPQMLIGFVLAVTMLYMRAGIVPVAQAAIQRRMRRRRGAPPDDAPPSPSRDGTDPPEHVESGGRRR